MALLVPFYKGMPTVNRPYLGGLLLSEDDGCYTDNIVFYMTSHAGVQGAGGGQCSHLMWH